MLQAARSFGCEVDTLTLSKEQKALADERIKAAGLENKIRVHLMDYRDLPPHFEKAFDAFVSIEMVEVRELILLILIQSKSVLSQNQHVGAKVNHLECQGP